MNVAEALIHALRDHGAREIFGIPGDFALPYFKVFEESLVLPLYTLSDEPGVIGWRIYFVQRKPFRRIGTDASDLTKLV
jgi:hypothetical protein